MIKGIRFGICVLFASFAVVEAGQAAEVGNPAAGKEKSTLCQGCHGEDGISVNPMCPNLAGQFPKYIEKQIRDFQKEKRVDPIMSGMAAMITEKQDADRHSCIFFFPQAYGGYHQRQQELD